MLWLRNAPVAGFAFANASTGFHPVAARPAPELRACRWQLACDPPGKSRHPNESCGLGPRSGCGGCSTPNPDRFPLAQDDGHRRLVAARDENAGSKMVCRLAADTDWPSPGLGLLPAASIIDHGDQIQLLTSSFQPVVFTGVPLHQFAIARTPRSPHMGSFHMCPPRPP